MRSIKAIGLAAVMAMALMATAGAATASAQDFYQGGKLLSNTLTFSGVSSEGGTLETVGGNQVLCSSDSSSGETSGSNGVKNVRVTYKGCRGLFGLVTCTTPGQSSGTIVTNLLKGSLVGVELGEGVGMQLEPESTELFTEFNCAFVNVKVRGSVTGLVSPVGEESKSGTLTFEQSGGQQNPPSELESKVGSGSWEESGVESHESVTFSEAVEVK